MLLAGQTGHHNNRFVFKRLSLVTIAQNFSTNTNDSRLSAFKRYRELNLKAFKSCTKPIQTRMVLFPVCQR